MKPELLAPAGSKESFYAALRSGADAVYMAAEKFGARAYAGNFTYDEIFECADFAHVYGKKIYLTVNTLVKENEFGQLREFIESGVPDVCDGLIIQDLGVASFFRKERPLIPIHASTQMSVTGPAGASLLKGNGFTRVVPARELSFEEIKDIYDATGMEIECFIHGAMCYSYSGQCLFSSILGGRSGNRGRCAQPCRLPYRLSGSKEKTETYPLSLKDMCTLEILPDILSAGAVSLKVEGRMKPPQYVAGVISVYRKYLDMYLSGDEYAVDKKDLEFLSGLYVRGDLSHGYFDRHNSRDMVTIYSHGYNGSEDEASDRAKTLVSDDADNPYVGPLKVRMSASFKIGQNAYVTASCVDPEGKEAYGYAGGEIVSKAEKASIGTKDILKAFKKTGNTVFVTDDHLMDIDVDDNAFYSLKGLNQLRRDVLDDLMKNLIHDPVQNEGALTQVPDTDKQSVRRSVIADKTCSILIGTYEQAFAVAKAIKENILEESFRIYLEESLIMSDDADEIFDLFGKEFREDVPVYAALSFIRRKGDDLKKIFSLLEEGSIDGLLIRNLEDLAVFSKKYSERIITDFGLYSYNAEASGFWSRYSGIRTMPLELSGNEMSDLIKASGNVTEKVIYGRAPLMITAGCVRKTLKSCTHRSGFETIIDRKGIGFPVKCDCGRCLNIIYNSVPLLVRSHFDERLCGRIEFTTENADEVMDVFRVYAGIKDINDIPHTSGWSNRPVS
ncbi:MAG: U32 family peptidase [Lachnospiraceae bacterium]|nr:U32 family peptidase [Lachnospiraceae bacterium]